MSKSLSRLLCSLVLALVCLGSNSPGRAASLTPPNLTSVTTINNGDLLLVWPTGTSGPLSKVQWSVAEALMQAALGASYLQASNNLSDVPSPTTARSNLGLASAAIVNTGTSGATIPLLNSTANTWGGKQNLPASTTSAAPLNLGQGSAPTTPVNGDCWITTTSLNCRVNGSTQSYGTSSGTVSSIATNNGLTGGTITTSGTIGLATITANSALVNATASSAVPVAAALPSCSATGAALQYTTSTGFNCATGYAPLASPAFTGSAPTSGGTALVLTTDSRFGGPTPNNIGATGYTFAASDCGKEVTHFNGSGSDTFTIPSNASVPIAQGCKIELINYCGSFGISLAITTDTLTWLPTAAVGTRSLAQCALVTLTKINTNQWWLTGVNISRNDWTSPAWASGTQGGDGEVALRMAA